MSIGIGQYKNWQKPEQKLADVSPTIDRGQYNNWQRPVQQWAEVRTTVARGQQQLADART
jgi:hypothetical protein